MLLKKKKQPPSSPPHVSAYYPRGSLVGTVKEDAIVWGMRDASVLALLGKFRQLIRSWPTIAGMSRKRQ